MADTAIQKSVIHAKISPQSGFYVKLSSFVGHNDVKGMQRSVYKGKGALVFIHPCFHLNRRAINIVQRGRTLRLLGKVNGLCVSTCYQCAF